MNLFGNQLDIGGGKIKRELIMAVLLLCVITLPFSAGTAFASTNITNGTSNPTITNNLTNVTNQTTKTAANTTTVKAAGSPTATSSFTSKQINTAATNVTNFVNTNHRLPSYVTIANVQVTMPQFLQLITANLLNINKGLNKTVTLKTVKAPANSSETVKTGNLQKSEYLALAQTIVSSGTVPSYLNTTLGKMNFNNLVYTFSKILNFQTTNNRLANYVSVTPWSSISSTSNSVTPVGTVQTVDQIMQVASKYRYISGISNAAGLIANGGGDCWAMSDYLYKQLTATHIRARIIQYATEFASNHRSVQYYINGAWVSVPYRQYFSTDLFNDVANSNYAVIADNKL